MLTLEQKQKYLESDGRICPLCGSDNLDATTASQVQEDKFFRAEVECLQCKVRWTDVYQLVNVEEWRT